MTISPEVMDPVGIRLPFALSQLIRERAAKNRRSLNSEIIVLLERTLDQQVTVKDGKAE